MVPVLCVLWCISRCIKKRSDEKTLNRYGEHEYNTR